MNERRIKFLNNSIRDQLMARQTREAEEKSAREQTTMRNRQDMRQSADAAARMERAVQEQQNIPAPQVTPQRAEKSMDLMWRMMEKRLGERRLNNS